MRLLPSSVRTRLTLWYTLALALPLVAFAVASYLTFSHTVRERTDAFVSDALTVFARELGAERRAGPSLDEAMRRTLSEVRFREVDIAILDASGGLVGTSPHLAPAGGGAASEPPDAARLAEAAGRTGGSESRMATVRRAGRAYRVLARPFSEEGRSFRLVGIHPLADVEAMLGRIRRLFLVAIPLIIAFAAGGGLFLARRSFAPVSAMAARAAEIGANTLDERLPIVADDELGHLARVLNDLLDRLERSFETQRRFMTDASHELRTPAAIVRTETDVTLSREGRPEEEYRASLEIIGDASRRLGRIVEDLFLLARADAGHLVLARAPLRLDEVVRETARTATPLAEERGVRVELGSLPEAPLVGDEDLLGRLVLNLLDNAIRHSPAGSAVEVSMRAADGAWDLRVVDAGPGIPPEAAGHVFERFFRVDQARAREGGTLTSGAGLGLSICRRIASLHGGDVELVGSRPGRTELRLVLPREPAAVS
ncbi:MAG TPA: ATP-binding protein [Gemmatimonadota bacterium]|nr:ATP-binding protein [Gemmatimonadota bacterium]